ncbi:hypothetical protein SLEP1_g17739 [Rubroshorea leprosula]|uniref:WAT1-related protein n=1 Tax=Rubroshorea leprosula TaxID=152421 RepID=A0AAV5IYW3_9ROSI|nr:hypothetical protein SLEP1_g17739 [Rubroshorea leprosula]
MHSFSTIKPYLTVILLQLGAAGLDILSKAALNQGMSNYVLVVYRNAVATIVAAPFAVIFDKKVRPKMTVAVFTKIMVLALLEPAIDQNLYYLGMKYTTATFVTALYNIVPPSPFSWLGYLSERMMIKSIHSHAKVIGTILTVTGAMVMTLMRGPMIPLSWTGRPTTHEQATNGTDVHSSIKGGLMAVAGCFCSACFMILQAVTLKTYSAALSLTAWVCLLGTIEGSIVALVMERGKASVWAIKWDTNLLIATYSGVISSGLTYYIQGIIMKDRGPVFVTAFSPLCMVIVAVMSSFIFAEQMFLGRVTGAIIIIVGLYLVLWGKRKDYRFSSPSMEEEIQASEQKQGNGLIMKASTLMS